MCRPAVNADIRFSKNCRSWYDPKSPKTYAHNVYIYIKIRIKMFGIQQYKINE